MEIYIPVAGVQGMNGWMELPWQQSNQLGDDLNALGKKGEGFELTMEYEDGEKSTDPRQSGSAQKKRPIQTADGG